MDADTPGTAMVVIDTDIFVLAFAFHRDDRQATNTRFLDIVQHHQPAVTIYSVMELLGQLSFNLSAERLTQWPVWLQNGFGLSVLYPETGSTMTDDFFRSTFVDGPIARMGKNPIPYLDSIILELVEGVEDIHSFVTWNARHFQRGAAVRVLTPEEFLLDLP